MTNYEMRKIGRAMGGKGKSAVYKNERALDDLLRIGSSITDLRRALSAKSGMNSRKRLHEEKSKEFIERMEATEKINEPLRLASTAKTNLETLLDALETKGTVRHGEWEQKMVSLDVALTEISRLSDKCAKAVKRLRVKVIKKNK